MTLPLIPSPQTEAADEDRRLSWPYRVFLSEFLNEASTSITDLSSSIAGFSTSISDLSSSVASLSASVSAFSGSVGTMHKASFKGNGVDQTILDNTYTVVSFPSVDFDVGGVFSNPTMTIVQDGVYVIAATVNYFIPFTATIGIEIWDGSSSIGWSYRNAEGGTEVLHISKTVSATVGQQFSFQTQIAPVSGTLLGASQGIYGSIIQVL